jgi:hypothetical protein
VVDEAQTVKAGGSQPASTGIGRCELQDIVAEPPDEHVDLLGTGPEVHS